MKNLYIVGGPMGVGKTTVCQLLKRELQKAVFLDGDWCWDMDPFQVTEETKGMVMENIAFLLNRFLRCSAYENVIFCWVLHRQEIVDELLGKLDVENGAVSVRRFSLICGEAELERRLRRDIDSGLRQGDVIERSLSRLPLYDKVDAVKIDVTDLSPEQTAALICGMAVEEHARVVI